MPMRMAARATGAEGFSTTWGVINAWMAAPNSPEKRRGEKAVKRVASRMEMLRAPITRRTACAAFPGRGAGVGVGGMLMFVVIVPQFGLKGQGVKMSHVSTGNATILG